MAERRLISPAWVTIAISATVILVSGAIAWGSLKGKTDANCSEIVRVELGCKENDTLSREGDKDIQEQLNKLTIVVTEQSTNVKWIKEFLKRNHSN